MRTSMSHPKLFFCTLVLTYKSAVNISYQPAVAHMSSTRQNVLSRKVQTLPWDESPLIGRVVGSVCD